MSKSYGPDRLVCNVDRHALRRLRQAGVLHAERDARFFSMTCGELYQAWADSGARLPGFQPAAALREARFIRHVCGCKDAPPLLSMIKLSAELSGTKTLTLLGLRPHIGTITHEQMVEAARKLGLKASTSIRHASQGSLAEAFDVFPAGARALVKARLEAALAAGGTEPTAQDLGRALALPPALRLLAVGELFRLTTAKAVHGAYTATLKCAETMLTLGLGQGRTDDMEVLAEYAGGSDSIEPSDTRQRKINRYAIALRGAREWIGNVCKGEAGELLAQLPDHDLTHPLFRNACTQISKRAEESPDERDPLVEDQIARNPEIQRAVDNRMSQVRAIYSAYEVALSGSGAVLSRGEIVPFSVVAPAVLADGSLGEGQQIVRFRLMRADLAVREAIATCKDKHACSVMRNWLRDTLQEHEPKTLPVLSIYDGVAPVGRSDCEDPFFVDFYRWSIFDPRWSLSVEAVTHRAEMLAQKDLPYSASMASGFLKPERFERQFARYALTGDPITGLIAIPMTPLMHALLYGELAYWFSADTGGRALELQQIRLNDGAIELQSRDGEEVAVLWLRPKGFRTLREFIVSETTALLIPACAEFTATRFFDHVPGKRLSLPKRELHSAAGSRPLPMAEYLFQSENTCLLTDDITMALRALLWGISSQKLHDRRYGKATEMGDAQIPRKFIKRKLNHSSTSASTAKYDRSARLRAIQEARNFAEERSAGSVSNLSGTTKPSV